MTIREFIFLAMEYDTMMESSVQVTLKRILRRLRTDVFKGQQKPKDMNR